MAAATKKEGPWVPEGFTSYRELYPATPAFVLPELGPTARFAALWHALDEKSATRAALLNQLALALRGTTVLLVRGYLGTYMPGNLSAARRALGRLGIEALIADNRAAGLIAENARRMADQIRRRVDPARQLLLCGHSKGGLEARWLVQTEPELASRTRGVIMSQTPRGPSAVLESLLLRRHQESLLGARRRWAERLQRMSLGVISAVRSGTELTTEALAHVVTRLATAPALPLLQMASFSSRPTTWLDSFHQRLGEIRPGCAHDGQFYVEDLIWPDLPHVLLPHVDHAQPVMGGLGFDPARYWLATLLLFLDCLPTGRSSSSLSRNG